VTLLHTTTFGEGQPQVALVHGFTQTSNSMLPLATTISSRYTVNLVDAPNHGGSTDVSLDCSAGADALCATVGDATYIGYSMGARLCLHAALQHPKQVKALVLISGTAGIEDPEQRLQRRTSDETLADHIEQVGTEVFITEWLSRPMFSNLNSTPLDIHDRNRNTATSLATSLRLAGTGAQQSLWGSLHLLDAPVLLIAGEQDEAFCNNAKRMKELIGENATVAIVNNSGHSVHLEQLEDCAKIIMNWLDQKAN
jgi:2-succinyl-6-hydroxy-2,4-cyclohexadiene-1-carboxylate synthase